MTSPLSSRTSTEFFGRVCVIIPDQDYGLVERFTEGLLTAKKGTPDTTNSEYRSIKRAQEVCRELRLDDVIIYNDAVGAVQRAGVPEVQWLPAGEFNPASAFLDRVLKRTSYLRRSSRKVTKRMPLTSAQSEAFRLFQTEREEFKLSSSLLWTKIQSDRLRTS